MAITRRDFLKASSAVGAALGLTATGLLRLPEAFGKEGGLPVVWLQGQGCTGCSVSLLNSIYYATIDDLLVNTLDLQYHTTVMAAAGATAVKAAQDALAARNFLLVIEGAIPTGASGRYCTVWPGMTMYQAVRTYGAAAKYVVAVGACASFGGMSAGKPNPTRARSARSILGSKVINIPGCPANPDWVVGTIAYILKYGRTPVLDSSNRPVDYFGQRVHDNCMWRDSYVGPSHHSKGAACTPCHSSNRIDGRTYTVASKLGDLGCMYGLGCQGPNTYADCATRKWNSPAANTAGVNWCVQARVPCHGCTQPNFPDGMSPFFKFPAVITAGTGGTVNCRQCHGSGSTSGTLPSGHPAVGGSGGSTGGGGGTTPTPPAHANGQACTNCHSANDPRIQPWTNPTGGSTGGSTTTVNCLQCHDDDDDDIPSSGSGRLPSGHPSITGGSSGGSTGGSTTTVNCRQCHSSGSTAGTLPSGHPSISGSTGGGDDDEEDDD